MSVQLIAAFYIAFNATHLLLKSFNRTSNYLFANFFLNHYRLQSMSYHMNETQKYRAYTL